MSLSSKAFDVVSRPIPTEQIKKRPGKAGMEFSYITPDFVIDTLNEAFEHRWDTKIVYQGVHDVVVVVGLRLTVHDEAGNSIEKEQFGSCEITRGLGVGEAFKGATSDAMKKCATLLGVGLELYRDDDVHSGPPTSPQFRPPQAAPKGALPPKPVAAPAKPPAAAPAPRPPVASPARPVASVPVPKREHPFGVPVASPAPIAQRQPPAPLKTPPVAAPKVNPFAQAVGESTGPNSTQLNALVNLAQRKNVSPSNLIALASVTDGSGNPITTFEDLTRDQAIQVIRAAQQ